jgi:L-fuculose-phosphate aldolase
MAASGDLPAFSKCKFYHFYSITLFDGLRCDRQKLDVRTIPESWIFLQDMPNVPFGSQFAGEETILKMLSKNTPAIIINNDAVLVTGDKLLGTFDRLEVAEFSAKSLTMAASLGELIPINSVQVEELRKKFLG